MPNILSKSSDQNNVTNRRAGDLTKFNVQDYEYTHINKRTNITDNNINYKQNNPQYYQYKNVNKI